MTCPQTHDSECASLSDRAAIADLLFHYAYCIDTAQPQRLTEVFVDDVLAEYGYGIHAGGAWRGSAEVIAGLANQIAMFDGTAHMITNVNVAVDGDRARSTAYVCAWHWLHDGGVDPERPADFMLAGVYIDRLHRLQRGWRIVHRRFRRSGPSALALGTMPAFMRPQE
jgi:SnoaL-like domain